MPLTKTASNVFCTNARLYIFSDHFSGTLSCERLNGRKCTAWYFVSALHARRVMMMIAPIHKAIKMKVCLLSEFLRARLKVGCCYGFSFRTGGESCSNSKIVVLVETFYGKKMRVTSGARKFIFSHSFYSTIFLFK